MKFLKATKEFVTRFRLARNWGEPVVLAESYSCWDEAPAVPQIIQAGFAAYNEAQACANTFLVVETKPLHRLDAWRFARCRNKAAAPALN